MKYLIVLLLSFSPLTQAMTLVLIETPGSATPTSYAEYDCVVETDKWTCTEKEPEGE